MQGNAGNLSKADVTANTNFLGNMKFSPNNPYRMTSGLFQGMNAPGSSAMGSKNPKEMKNMIFLSTYHYEDKKYSRLPRQK